MQLSFCQLSLLLSVAWLTTTASANASAVVSGHIAHPTDKDIAVSFGTDPFTQEPLRRVTAKLDAQGNFRLELPTVKAPTEATFMHGNEYTTLFLTPGDNLRLSLDAAKFDESLRYTGTGAAANTYLSQCVLKFEANEEAKPLQKVKSSTPAQMQQLIDGYRKQRLAFLKSFAATHPLTPAFRAYARQSITFEWADNQLSFPLFYKRLNEKAPALPATYYGFLAQVKPSQDSAQAMNNGSYQYYLTAFASNRLDAPDQLPSPEALVSDATKQFGKGSSRDVVLSAFVYNAFRTHEASELTSYMPVFQRTVRDSASVRTVRTLYRQRLLLTAGQAAPGVTVRDAEGKPVTLADFAGKVVYLDFWASWCKPCMAEMPASAVLKQKFAGKDVAFLYISVDDEEANWKKALAEHPLASANSVHGWDKGFEAPTAKAYQIESIPSYFIIGRDGKLVSTRAPRPSSASQTAAALDKALAK